MASDPNPMKDVSVIVLAAGSGSRFGKPKQFLELKTGVRLVDAAAESAFEVTDNVVLVLPDGNDWDGRPVQSVVVGGKSRLDSVAAGLSALPEDQKIVVVHDAAHPLAPKQTFLDVIEKVRDGADAALPVLPVYDVVKQQNNDGNLITVGRDGLSLAQVPMGFSVASLKSAHRQRSKDVRVWEDSMLVEQAGGTVVAVQGSPMNIHVVTHTDLELVRAVVRYMQRTSTLNGISDDDLHP